MEDYIRARPDVFFTGPGRQPALQPRLLPGGRALRLRPVHRLDAADRPRRQQLDRDARRASPASAARPTWAPTRAGRRHASPRLAQGRPRGARRPTGADAARAEAGGADGRDLPRAHAPGLRREARCLELAESAGMELPPVMIYGDDVTHILTEEGIANLLLCRSDEEREQAIRGVAGYTAGRARARQAHGREPARPRRDPPPRGPRHRPARRRPRNLLAARSIKDLVRASGGLYDPPKRFRNW